MVVPQTFKSLIQRSANCLGYRIDKVAVEPGVVAPIDVFDLLVTRLAEERRENFFFVQVGANDGITDDPIRRYLTRYHWRGILIEPLPDVFARLVQNYRHEPQLIFENAALADADGTAQFFIADDAGEKNLTVFSSLRRDAVERALSWRRDMHTARERIRPIEVKTRSVKSLLDQHRISRIDLLQSDAQGYDCKVVRQFLDCGLRPQIIHFEHIHADRNALHECYQRLVHDGYQFNEMTNDTVAHLGVTDTETGTAHPA
jgi:FkbM family methyltransferase